MKEELTQIWRLTTAYTIPLVLSINKSQNKLYTKVYNSALSVYSNAQSGKYLTHAV